MPDGVNKRMGRPAGKPQPASYGRAIDEKRGYTDQQIMAYIKTHSLRATAGHFGTTFQNVSRILKKHNIAMDSRERVILLTQLRAPL